MGWFRRVVDKIAEPDYDGEWERELDNDFRHDPDPDDVEPPTPLGKLMERVMEYREEEIRALRAKAYEAEHRADSLLHDLSRMTYERNEALQRIAKIIAILNKKQTEALVRAPFNFARTEGFEIAVTNPQEGGENWRIAIPPPAKMETVRRKGSHGGRPLTGLLVYDADQKTAKSNRDIEREQATLRGK
jgi:hypothetical protein